MSADEKTIHKPDLDGPVHLMRMGQGDVEFGARCRDCGYGLRAGDWAQDRGDHLLCEDCARP